MPGWARRLRPGTSTAPPGLPAQGPGFTRGGCGKGTPVRSSRAERPPTTKPLAKRWKQRGQTRLHLLPGHEALVMPTLCFRVWVALTPPAHTYPRSGQAARFAGAAAQTSGFCPAWKGRKERANVAEQQEKGQRGGGAGRGAPSLPGGRARALWSSGSA